MKNTIDNSNGTAFCSLGIDGCKGGWICVALEGEQFHVRRFSDIAEIMDVYPSPDAALIDMPIGLQSSTEHVRPDSSARHMIRERASTIFPAPCRQAVYAESVARQYDENERVLGKKFTPLTVGIIPKIREVDEFLASHPRYRNFLMESHPEVCFAVLNGKTLLSKKNTSDGLRDRVSLLRKYLPELSAEYFLSMAKQLHCMADDIVDAVCLAVAGTFVAENQYDTVPSDPMADEIGLLMRIVFPKLHCNLHSLERERLDIVDEAGNPTGETVDRETAHREGILHRTSHVWILREHHESVQVLLQQRSRNKDSFPGCYDISSAGHIPAGDGFVESALRELEEELGLEANAEELIFCGQRRFQFQEEFRGQRFLDNQVSNVYVIWRNPEPDEWRLQSSEVETVVWMDWEQCVDMVRTNREKHCIWMEELELIANHPRYCLSR